MEAIVEEGGTEDGIGHYCGIAGIYSPEIDNIPSRLFYSLFALQHRGQESAGICFMEDGALVTDKNSGMVSAVLSHYLREVHESKVGIGHTRYSTAGGSSVSNAQPLQVNCCKGKLALAHNGNIANGPAINAELTDEGAIFQTSSDSELILHLISRSKKADPVEILKEAFSRLEGSYSLLFIYEGALVAARDPLGFRPLHVGKKNGIHYVASETCALQLFGVDEWREVEPGEIIWIDDSGLKSYRFGDRPRTAKCVFELIYFARPDSRIFNLSVHEMRKKFGAALASRDTVKGDVVVPVPDSGNSAAIGYAAASGIPFDLGLTRNHYTGRSFIMPTTAQRELVVKMKLQPNAEAIAGKSVILIDDSLVRGTTSSILVKLLKDAGAREVHLRLCSPEIHCPCYYGIDIPTRKELISNRMGPAEISRHIGADSVMFLDLEALRGTLDGSEGYCYACFSGEYPTPITAGGE